MILRIDRLQTELPPPSTPDPVGASAVQELLGGKFGEMSTFMNYTYQSFNFRNRQGARPFYDLLASIAAEEFGHIELVAATINTMLTGAGDGEPGKSGVLKGVKDTRNTQQFIAGGAAALVQDSNNRPWTGDNVFSSGDLVEDLTHNFFLETGARNNKLKVYEMVEHPAARALTGFLLVRGGVHQIAYARALENLTGANLMKLFPSPAIPTDKIPECRPHIERGLHRCLYRFSPEDFKEIEAVFNGPHPETGEDLVIAEELHPQGAPANDLPSQTAVFAPGPDPGMIGEVAARLREAAGLPKKPTGVVANGGNGRTAAARKKEPSGGKATVRQ
jgi:Mn-containing catalase